METITILIPTYNNGDKLSRCLDSIINQTYSDIKVIILNDKSTDNTKEVIDGYVDKLNIHYVENDINLGRGESRNKLLKLSETKLSCWLDSDDYMHKDKINKQYEYFVKNPECTFLATPMYDLVSPTEIRDGGSNYELIKGVTLENIKITNHIPHPTVMFKTEIAKNLGFSINLNREEDLDFYIRLYQMGHKVDVIPNKLYYYNSY